MSRRTPTIRRSHGSSCPIVVSGPWPGSTRTSAGTSLARRERCRHLLIVAAGEVGPAIGSGEEDVAREQEPVSLLIQADRSLRVPGRVQHVEDEVADPDLLSLDQVAGRPSRLQLEPVVVSAIEPIRVIRMDRERRLRCLHQRGVVEDVVDVPVRVRDEVQAEPVGRGALDQRGGGSHAGIEDEGIGRAAVPDEVGVRLHGPNAAGLDPRAVRRIVGRAPACSTTTYRSLLASAARTHGADGSIRQAQPEVPGQLSGEFVLDLLHRDRAAKLCVRGT